MKRLLAAASLALALAACNDQYASSGRSLAPLPPRTMALMESKGMQKSDPILVRLYKKESELEVWKKAQDGQYALLKSYPICRWSGQLGPKRKEGDRQAPEGFYTVTPGQMNPNSAYYLSFDTGYPNAYDRDHGGTGSQLMVHGTCSSRGCYAMTDEGIAEVYALAREAFAGGQKGFQFQAYPFRMTAQNLAKFRKDPNMPFWANLKEGADHFEITKREPKVAVCGGRYAFDTVGGGCTPDPTLAPTVAEKEAQDRQAVAELVAKGAAAVRLVYADGGGHESFRQIASLGGSASSDSSFTILDATPRRNIGDVSRPDALAQGPQEVAMDDVASPRTVVAAVSRRSAMKMASAANGQSTPKSVPASSKAPSIVASTGPARTLLASADPDQPAPAAASVTEAKPFYARVLAGVTGSGAKAEPAVAPVSPEPTASKVETARTVKPTALRAAPKKPDVKAAVPPSRPTAKSALAARGEKHVDASLIPGTTLVEPIPSSRTN